MTRAMGRIGLAGLTALLLMPAPAALAGGDDMSAGYGSRSMAPSANRPAAKPFAVAVNPATPADRPLAEAVAAALEKTLYIAPYGVTVATDTGRVILFGAVPTLFTLALADQVAAGVPGVAAVDNRLVVSSLDPSLVNPYAADTQWPSCIRGHLCVGG